MKFTGERFVPGEIVEQEIVIEHLQRYEAILEYVKDKVVVDAASGEGYGSQILAQVASKVYGVDISREAVEAARNEGATEVEVVAIFSYEFEKAYKNFGEKNIKWETLSNFTALLELAKEEKYLTEEEAEIAASWNKNTDTWGR